MRFDFFSPQVKDNSFSSLIMLVLGVIILSLQDSLIKLMSSETSFWQLQFIRSIGNIFLLIQGFSELLKSYWAAKKGEWPGEDK